jgi:hypothetical protein
MCHHYESTAWWIEHAPNGTEEQPDDDDDERWQPDGFEERRDVKVDLMTDGGDE